MSNFSINTNVGASVALHSLASIQTGFSRVQNQVSTGQKVSRAQDNAGVFAVAQGVRANLAQYDAVGTALNDGQSLVTATIAGVTAISNLVTGLSQTLTQLADGSINDAQRRTYTSTLKAQIDEVKTFIDGATYNGINLITANNPTSTKSLGAEAFTAYNSAANVSVLSGLNNSSLTIHAQNLFGGTAGTDGWLGLARLSYIANQVTYVVPFVVTNTYPMNGIDTDATSFLESINGQFSSRQSVSQLEAILALQSGTLMSFSFTSQPGFPGYVTAVSGTTSVFTGAIASFSAQVNVALGSLGADNTNIQSQITFVQSLSDAASTGLGNLVDADMAQASAQLTALQTQQQLATQALGIANAQPSNILALFGKAA